MYITGVKENYLARLHQFPVSSGDFDLFKTEAQALGILEIPYLKIKASKEFYQKTLVNIGRGVLIADEGGGDEGGGDEGGGDEGGGDEGGGDEGGGDEGGGDEGGGDEGGGDEHDKLEGSVSFIGKIEEDMSRDLQLNIYSLEGVAYRINKGDISYLSPTPGPKTFTIPEAILYGEEFQLEWWHSDGANTNITSGIDNFYMNNYLDWILEIDVDGTTIDTISSFQTDTTTIRKVIGYNSSTLTALDIQTLEESIQLDLAVNLQELSIYPAPNLTAVSLNSQTNLTMLVMGYNNVNELNITSQENLEELYIESMYGLTTLYNSEGEVLEGRAAIIGHSSIGYCGIYGSSIAELRVVDCQALYRLEMVGSAHLTEVVIENCGSLEDVYFAENNNLSSITISGNILYIYVAGTNLSSGAVDALINSIDTENEGGSIYMEGQPRTSASDTNYDRLVLIGWTIDIAEPQ
jgi:hypothetical protein